MTCRITDAVHLVKVRLRACGEPIDEGIEPLLTHPVARIQLAQFDLRAAHHKLRKVGRVRAQPLAQRTESSLDVGRFGDGVAAERGRHGVSVAPCSTTCQVRQPPTEAFHSANEPPVIFS